MGEVEKNSFTAVPGKGGHQQANALKTVCPTPERVVRSFFLFVFLFLCFFFNFFKKFIYLFIYGCVGPSFLCEGFL